MARMLALLSWAALSLTAAAEEPEASSPIEAVHEFNEHLLARLSPEATLLHEKGTSARIFGLERGGIDDFRAKTIRVQNTLYWTEDAAEASLASYGKTTAGERFDRMGLIQGVEYSIEGNSWSARYALNADALLMVAGGRFEEYAGMTFRAAADQKKTVEITFQATNVPKKEVLHKLNRDVEALEYFDGLLKKMAAYEKLGLKKRFAKRPAEPRVVLSNITMLGGNIAKAVQGSIDGKIHTRVLGDAVELKVVGSDHRTTTWLSPVVRCYRMYLVEFKRDDDEALERIDLVDADGNVHHVPQIFDLTPDSP